MMNNKPSNRLVKHIIRSYARLAENSIVRDILKSNIPPIMRDKNFINELDDSSKKWMRNLQILLAEKSQMPQMNQMPAQNTHLNTMNMNMMGQMMMPQMQLGQMPTQQSYMMQQQTNDYGYGGMYPETYINGPSPKGMFGMPQGPMGGKNYPSGMGPYYGFQK